MDGILEEDSPQISADEPRPKPKRSNAASFLKNSLMLTLIGFSVSVLGVVYRVYMARYLGDAKFGTYTWITVFVSYFSVISLFGFRQVIVRQIASARDKIAEYAAIGLEYRLASGSLAVLLITITALVLKRTDGIEVLVVVGGFSLLLVALKDMIDAAFLGLEKSEYSAISSVTANLLKVGIGIYLLTRGFGLLAIFILLNLTALLDLSLGSLLLRYKLGIRISAASERSSEMRKYVFHEAVPFVWVMMITKVYAKNDMLVLGWLKGDKAVGWYSGAYMAVDFLLLVAMAIGNAVYPIFSRLQAEGTDVLRAHYERLLKYVFVMFLPVCALTSVVGSYAIPVVLGHRFSKGVDALQIVVWMVLFESMSLISGMMMSATGNQKLMAKTGLFSAMANLLLVLCLVPRFSYVGAAWATLIGAVIQLAIAVWAVGTILKTVSLFRALHRAAAAAIITLALTVGALRLTGAWQVAMTVSAVSYVVLLLAIRVFDEKDMATLSHLADRFRLRVRQA